MSKAEERRRLYVVLIACVAMSGCGQPAPAGPAWVTEIAKKCLTMEAFESEDARELRQSPWTVQRVGEKWIASMPWGDKGKITATVDDKTRQILECRIKSGVF